MRCFRDSWDLGEHVETSELIKFGILALIVVVIALVARRGQAHSTPAPPKKADHITEETDADNGHDRRSAAAGEDTRTAGSRATTRRERRRRRRVNIAHLFRTAERTVQFGRPPCLAQSRRPKFPAISVLVLSTDLLWTTRAARYRKVLGPRSRRRDEGGAANVARSLVP